MKTFSATARLYALTTLCIGLSVPVQAEDQKQDAAQTAVQKQINAQEAVATLVNQVRKGEPVNHTAVSAAPPDQVLAEFKKYLNDPDENVHVMALYNIRAIAIMHKEPSIQRQAIEVIFAIAEEGDMADQATAAAWLQRFSSVYFTPHMKEVIARLVNQEPPDEDAIALVGIAQVQAVSERLRALSQGGNWQATLSLARLGDKASLQQVIAKFAAEPNSQKRIHLLGDLAFTRQPEAIALIIPFAFSDVRTPSLGDGAGSAYADDALYFLRGIIEDFPERGEKSVAVAGQKNNVTKKVSREESLQAAREWLAERNIAELTIKK